VLGRVWTRGGPENGVVCPLPSWIWFWGWPKFVFWTQTPRTRSLCGGRLSCRLG